MSALEEQQKMMLCVMSEVVRLRKFMEGLGCVCGAEEKVVKEGGELSGRHSVQVVGASAMKESGKGKAQSMPVSFVEAPCMQAEVCNSGCDSAASVVGGTPNQP